jgi:hypothetical protein
MMIYRPGDIHGRIGILPPRQPATIGSEKMRLAPLVPKYPVGIALWGLAALLACSSLPWCGES